MQDEEVLQYYENREESFRREERRVENLFIGCSKCAECSSLLERVMFDETRGVFAYINRTDSL